MNRSCMNELSSSEWEKLTENQLEIIESIRQHYPVEVFALAKALGLSVSYETLNGNISGKIINRDSVKSGFDVILNRKSDIILSRFTLARAIGIYLLYPNLIGEAIADTYVNRTRLGEEIDLKLNRFAYDILMPVKLIREISNEFNITFTEVFTKEFSDKLAVPSAAIKNYMYLTKEKQHLLGTDNADINELKRLREENMRLKEALKTSLLIISDAL